MTYTQIAVVVTTSGQLMSLYLAFLYCRLLVDMYAMADFLNTTLLEGKVLSPFFCCSIGPIIKECDQKVTLLCTKL